MTSDEVKAELLALVEEGIDLCALPADPYDSVVLVDGDRIIAGVGRQNFHFRFRLELERIEEVGECDPR